MKTSWMTGALLGGAVLVSTGVQAADWPQWRGPERTGISTETGLNTDWTAKPPKLLWTQPGMGSGYASVTVAGGKIYTVGYAGGMLVANAKGKKRLEGAVETLFCLDEKDGKQLWSLPIGKAASVGYEGSRCSPSVDGGHVYAISAGGDLVCATTAGKQVWSKSFTQDFGGRTPGWGYAESPLIDGDMIIVTPGGRSSSIVALKKTDGSVIWKSDAPVGGAAGYSSAVVSNGAGVKQYVQLMGKGAGVVGVDAATGKALWNYDRIANGTANIPTCIIKGDYVLASTGYNDGGTALLKLVPAGSGGVKVEEVWYKESRDLQNHHGGMILLGDYVYLGNKHNNGFPTCIELLTGAVKWGKDERGPGSGSAALTLYSGHVIFRYQDHTVALFEATPDGKKAKGTFKIPDGQKESWAHPVVANGRLYLRNQDKLLCYDLK